MTDLTTTCYRHPERYTGVACARCGRYLCFECMRSAPVGFQCADCMRGGNKTKLRTRFGGVRASGTSATQWIIGICVAVFIVDYIFGIGLNYSYGLQPDSISYGQFYRLFTTMFLHTGLLHLGFNMYALWVLGPGLEHLMGRARFLLVYLGSGLAGSTLSYYLLPSNAVSVGASGAIFGLLTATLVVGRAIRADTTQLAILLGLNVLLSFSVSGIDWRAHLGGALAGAWFARAVVKSGRSRFRLILRVLPVFLVMGALVAWHTYQLAQFH